LRRLREHQLVTLELQRPSASVECLVVAVEADEASLHLVDPADAARLPSEKNAYLTFEHRSRLVMLRGTASPQDSGEVRFQVTDHVTVPQRRRSARVDVPLALELKPLGVDGQPTLGGTLTTRTRDVSADGLLADVLLPADHEHVRLVLSMPDDGPPLECDARVVRRVGGGTGLRFRQISTEDRERLKRFVAEHKRALLAQVRKGHAA
jgi:PilZ domain